jgi:hypothetical protein
VEGRDPADDDGVNLLLSVRVFALVVAMSAAVIAAYLLPPEDSD